MTPTASQTVPILLCTILSFASVQARDSEQPGVQRGSSADASIVDRFLESGTPELVSYAARRVMSASTRDGRMHAQLEAWTSLEPNGTFSFHVVCAQGSGLIRERVLLAALEAEQESRKERTMAQAALTRENYELVPTALRNDEREIQLRPRRKSQMLIEGSAYVRGPRADLTRVEGQLSKTPSWWTKRVTVVRRYARIDGVRVPVEMTSTADVRIVGASSFAMTYDYATINGRPLAVHQEERCSLPSQAQA